MSTSNYCPLSGPPRWRLFEDASMPCCSLWRLSTTDVISHHRRSDMCSDSTKSEASIFKLEAQPLSLSILQWSPHQSGLALGSTPPTCWSEFSSKEQTYLIPISTPLQWISSHNYQLVQGMKLIGRGELGKSLYQAGYFSWHERIKSQFRQVDMHTMIKQPTTSMIVHKTGIRNASTCLFSFTPKLDLVINQASHESLLLV